MMKPKTNPIKKTVRRVRNAAASTAKKADDYLEAKVPSMTNTGLYKDVKKVAKKMLKKKGGSVNKRKK